jgi:transposase
LEEALAGRVRAQHRFLLREHLEPSDDLDAAHARLSTESAPQLSAEEEAVARRDTIAGGSQRVAQLFVAEVGSALSRPFLSAKHRASWAGRCPGNHASAGQRLSGKTRKGSRWLRQALTEAAQAAARRKNTSLSAQFHRIAARRGKRWAVVAVAHPIRVIAYHLLTWQETSRDLGAASFDDLDRKAVERRLVRRLERLGYQVALTATSEVA